MRGSAWWRVCFCVDADQQACKTKFLGQSSAQFRNSHSKYIDSGQQSIIYDVEAPWSIGCGIIVSSCAVNRLFASCSCGTRIPRFRARLRGFGVPVAGTMPPRWWPQSSSLRELMGCRNKLCVLIRHTRHSSWILLMIINWPCKITSRISLVESCELVL